jgi:hypothetical protein
VRTNIATLLVFSALIVTILFWMRDGRPRKNAPRSAAPLANGQSSRKPLTGKHSDDTITRTQATSDMMRKDLARTVRTPPIPAKRTASEGILSLTNAGNDTATAGVQTFLWAAANGRLDTTADLICFVWRPGAEQYFSSVPEAVRKELGTPEKLVAAMYQNLLDSVSDIQISRTDIVGPRDVVFRVRLVSEDGSTSEEEFIMRRTNAGWQKQEYPYRVDELGRQLRGEKSRFDNR